MLLDGGVSRVAKGADCKSAVLRLRRFESFFPHHPSLAKREKTAAPKPNGRRRAVAASYGSAGHPPWTYPPTARSTACHLLLRIRESRFQHFADRLPGAAVELD